MHQNSVTLDSAGAITRYFAKANLPTQHKATSIFTRGNCD